VNRRLAILALVVLAVFLGSTTDASACAACFGKSDSKLAEGMNAGIFTLLAIICAVLCAIASFFWFIVRRAITHPLPIPSETLSSVATSNA
jgi:hypothetical protein